MKIVHWIQVGIAAVVAGAASVAQNDPQLAHYALELIAALTPIGVTLGVVSKSATSPESPVK